MAAVRHVRYLPIQASSHRRVAVLLRFFDLTTMPHFPFRQDWLSNVRNDLLAGLVVALALIPEAIAFSIIAGVDPKVGLYASFCIATVIAFTGGRPGMISAATGAMALVMVTLVKDHGLQYLLAATVLTGVLQILAGWLHLGALMRFVSRSVITGFVNALAILIFVAQLPELIGATWVVYAMVAGGLGIIYLFPYLTKAIPSPLVAIVVLSGLAIYLGLDIRTVGDMGQLPDSLPIFLLPEVPLNLETLKIILPVSATLAVVGLLESMMTASIVDDLTDSPSDKNRECVGQGVANIASGFLGGHGGLRHDRAVGDQREIRRAWTSVHTGGGRFPVADDRVHRRLGGAHSHGRAGGGDDHGVRRHLQLGFDPKAQGAPQEFQSGDGRHSDRGGGFP